MSAAAVGRFGCKCCRAADGEPSNLDESSTNSTVILPVPDLLEGKCRRKVSFVSSQNLDILPKAAFRVLHHGGFPTGLLSIVPKSGGVALRKHVSRVLAASSTDKTLVLESSHGRQDQGLGQCVHRRAEAQSLRGAELRCPLAARAVGDMEVCRCGVRRGSRDSLAFAFGMHMNLHMRYRTGGSTNLLHTRTHRPTNTRTERVQVMSVPVST